MAYARLRRVAVASCVAIVACHDVTRHVEPAARGGEKPIAPTTVIVADTLTAYAPTSLTARFADRGPRCEGVGLIFFRGSPVITMQYFQMRPEERCAEHTIDFEPEDTWRTPDMPAGLGRALVAVCHRGRIVFRKQVMVRITYDPRILTYYELPVDSLERIESAILSARCQP